MLIGLENLAHENQWFIYYLCAFKRGLRMYFWDKGLPVAVDC